MNCSDKMCPNLHLVIVYDDQGCQIVRFTAIGFRTFCAGQSCVLPFSSLKKSVRFLRFLAFKAKTSFLCSKVAIYNFLSIKRSKYIEDFQSKFCTLDFHYVHPPNKEHLKGWKEDKGPHWKNFTPLRFFKLYPPPSSKARLGIKMHHLLPSKPTYPALGSFCSANQKNLPFIFCDSPEIFFETHLVINFYILFWWACQTFPTLWN